MSKSVTLTQSLIPLVLLLIFTALGCSSTDTETEADEICVWQDKIT